MKRRTLIAAGVAVGAAAAGVAASRWHLRQSAQAAQDRAAEQAFWALRFQRPNGEELAMHTFRGQPLLLNFWATWCPPCLKEMPLLDAFYRDHRAAGWQVLGLAVDKPEPVQAYLRRLPMTFPIGIAASDGITLARTLGNAGGQLPFTVVFDAQGQIAHRRLGTVEPHHLAQWAG
jgi:thiol-disulfide isomerase/thioredoxin